MLSTKVSKFHVGKWYLKSLFKRLESVIFGICIFYSVDPMELNFGFLEMQKWNIPLDRAQRVDEKMASCASYYVFCHQQKIQKMSHFGILMTITPGVNKITKQITFSQLLFELYHFCISKSSKFSSMGSLLMMLWSVKYTFIYQRWHFQACYCNTDILLLYKVC